MKRVIYLFFFLSLTIFSNAQVTVIDSIMFDGVWRNYRVFLPTGFSASTSLPLVFNFHGYGSDALQQELYTQFDLVADTGNFLVCYPNGINNSWNIFGGAPDDVGFTDTLINILFSEYNINLNRVYSTGMSNGGFFSSVLACQLSGRIAAVAPVAGTNTNLIQNSCNPTRMVPILEIHGTADQTVEYNGTVGYLSVADLMQYWSSFNGCNNDPDTVAVPNTSMSDQCTAEIISWKSCDSNKQVVHYRIIGGGHSWPGAPVNINVTNMDFNASGVIWNFFNQFSLSTGINENVSENLKVYPNPFTTELQIELPLGKCTIELFSIDGKKIFTQSNVREKLILDSKYIRTGYYYLRITSPTSVNTIPVVRAR